MARKLTVQEVPLLLKPFLWLYGWVAAALFYLQLAVFRWTCRIEYRGKEQLASTPNHIFCIWHENLPLFFIAHNRFRKPNIWLTFPLWYMKPIHLLKRWIGIRELAFGASGHQGRQALELVLARLRQGWSTFLTPDGPKGPLKVMKDGALLMSMNTGTPVIPVSFYLSHGWRIPSWDRKRYPLPFTTLVVNYGPPIQVTAANMEAARQQLSRLMDDPPQRIAGSPEPPEL
ncbi:MAG: hypothetical protein D6730_05215 [Bacteroidetes bacterium]|nr:MAG: hypothetical protein D6730_05215 [Bacteroidota bacterium]